MSPKSDKTCSSESQSKNHPTTKPRRNWAPSEVEAVLQYLINTIKSGKAIEKPNAAAFYKSLLQNVDLEDCTVSQVKHQVGNLKKKYQTTIDWRNQTGQGNYGLSNF
jgi:hypothetical protein